ncbi:MAG: Methyltransferase FkbM family [Candidatus Woesebacteria bacterium GW2011_GWA1_39_8]|uniref:Methyltransferase FkbM family n=1 Tax=Candidatus Woesebacteria bacterium GW2011_GWA1_39_8 TaxID=1618552 RepID=A0A0G0PUR6_9BACT|nr:MAG: Methyltransferase FkbM family [Candidatus Woesebacteria bacterium GW2011_GWA1_39_8]
MNIFEKIYNKIAFTLGLLLIGKRIKDKITLIKWLYFPATDQEISFEIKVFDNSIILVLPNTRDQLMTVKSVFLDEDWYTKSDNLKVIFDLGGYTGISVAYFLLKYPKATVYVFEPNPYNVAYLIKNYSNNPKVIISDVAVGSTDGEMELYTTNDRSLSSSLSSNHSNLAQVQMVKTKMFDTICREIENIDLLKFNIEGAEENIFESKAIYTKVDMFIGEVHGDLISKKYSLGEFKKNLSQVFFIAEQIFTQKSQRGIWFGKRLN